MIYRWKGKRAPMNKVMPAMIECPFCSLPMPPYSTERPYCNRTCFDAHINETLEAYFDNSKTRIVDSKYMRAPIPLPPVSNKAGKHHKIDCSCFKC